jgi:hypothetical protein
MGVALALLAQMTANNATVLSSALDTTLASLSSSAAGLRASAPGTEGGNNAIDGAGLIVTGLHLVEGGARNATMSNGGDDRAVSLLGPRATGK